MRRFLASLLVAACGSMHVAQGAAADATARFLAGLDVPPGSLELAGAESVQAEHAAEFNRAWARLEERQLAKIRAWAPVYLAASYHEQSPLFYMFSGPDFLYAQAFFPNASTYVLCGTEPVGALPDLSRIPRAALGSSLANLRKSLDSVLSWSFFITKNMKVDLTQTQLSGTLPVLYVFLARAGCRIDSVQPVSLDSSGNAVPGKGTTAGVKISFFGPSGHQQTLYYFTTDLANDGIRSSPGFIRFCTQQGRGASLLKAASYLMHEEGFSKVRDFLLKNSTVILQDDSGIPNRFFTSGSWLVRYFGNFAGPIDLFKKYQQPDLAAVQASSHAPPLEFGFGYQWHPSRSSLLIAIPK